MSTHALGNVQLVTVQEVEAMLDEVVVPETSIDAKVAAETTAREAADTTLQNNIAAEATTRQTADDTLNTLISQEVQNRETADNALSSRLVTVETGLDDMKQTEVEELSNVHCSRFTNLPMATIQVDNDDKSINVGDTIATVSARYLPRIPVDFVMLSEQIVASASKTFLLMLRIDITGNINVINMVEFADGSAATDTAAVTYITKE